MILAVPTDTHEAKWGPRPNQEIARVGRVGRARNDRLIVFELPLHNEHDVPVAHHLLPKHDINDECFAATYWRSVDQVFLHFSF